MELNILYEDREIVVLEKPVGILSQSGTEGEETMLTLLQSHFDQKGEKAIPYVLHRLDREVGGVMVYAKSHEAAALFSGLIAKGEMEKSYYAVCHGDVAEHLGKEGALFDLLFKDSHKNKSFVTDRKRRGVKEAYLTYRLLGVKEGEFGKESLVFITLGTGRTHQIRVQFSSRQHPLLGDSRYGSRKRKGELALFSARLAFVHPKTKKQMTFTLPMPKAWGFAEEEGIL